MQELAGTPSSINVLFWKFRPIQELCWLATNGLGSLQESGRGREEKDCFVFIELLMHTGRL